MKKISNNINEPQGATFQLEMGPFQNNGASPWYSVVGVGSTKQPLKFSFDTGSSFIWVTSSLCAPDSCQHYGNEVFNITGSESFSLINKNPQEVDFGPWGKMCVQLGKDWLSLFSTNNKGISKISIRSDMYLAESYQGQQFEELDWDGGIGLPSSTTTPQTNVPCHSYHGVPSSFSNKAPSFHFFQSLLDEGVVSKKSPFVTFLTDGETKLGEMELGRLNLEYSHSREYLFLPWKAYSLVPYIWASPLKSFSVGSNSLIVEEDLAESQYFFCLDSGSSQFKGDPEVMNKAFELTTQYGEDVIIEMGITDQNEMGRIVIPSSIYNVPIEEGGCKGESVSQFAPLGELDGLVLAGSVLMDSLYTVHEYKVTGHGVNELTEPVGMWIFNKPNGPKIITTKQNKTARIFQSM